jgi:hypothetical protein
LHGCELQPLGGAYSCTDRIIPIGLFIIVETRKTLETMQPLEA